MGCSSSAHVVGGCKAEVEIANCGLAPGSHRREDFHRFFIFKDILGQGAFAQVHSAVEVTSGKGVAVKTLGLQPSSGAKGKAPLDKKVRQANKEVMVMMRLTQHPNCNCFRDDQLMYIVMEHCQSAFLEALHGLSDVTESTYADCFRQVFLALEYMHSKQVVHRDVKPDNFLCDRDGDGLRLKLGDYGLAEVLSSWSSAFPLTGVLGTAPYMSPEMVMHRGYGATTDVWSAGVSAYVLVLGDFPYKPMHPSLEGMQGAFADVAARPSFKPSLVVDPFRKIRISDAGERFLRTVLKRDRDTRPTAAKALGSAWLQPWSADCRQPSLRRALEGAKRVGAFCLRTRQGSVQTGPAGSLRHAAKVHAPHSRVTRSLTPSKEQEVYTREPEQPASATCFDPHRPVKGWRRSASHGTTSSKTDSTEADLAEAVPQRRSASRGTTSSKFDSTEADLAEAHFSSESASTMPSPANMLN